MTTNLSTSNSHNTTDSAVEQMRARKDAAYRERNACVALMVHMALALGWRAGISRHEDKPGEDWDPEWRTILTIDLPTGQASWHFHDSHKYLLEGIPLYSGSWDGHDTATKYARVKGFKYKQPVQGTRGVEYWKSLLADALLERDKERDANDRLRRELSSERLAFRDVKGDMSQARQKIAKLERQRDDALRSNNRIRKLEDDLEQAELATKVLADELETERAKVAELESKLSQRRISDYCSGMPERIWLHIDNIGAAWVSTTADDASIRSCYPLVERTIAYVPSVELVERLSQVHDLERELAAERTKSIKLEAELATTKGSAA